LPLFATVYLLYFALPHVRNIACFFWAASVVYK